MRSSHLGGRFRPGRTSPEGMFKKGTGILARADTKWKQQQLLPEHHPRSILSYTSRYPPQTHRKSHGSTNSYSAGSLTSGKEQTWTTGLSAIRTPNLPTILWADSTNATCRRKDFSTTSTSSRYT